MESLGIYAKTDAIDAKALADFAVANVARLQPLAGKILNQSLRALILQHPFDLRGLVRPQPAIVRDVQMHPARNAVVHVDLQRVLENEKLNTLLGSMVSAMKAGTVSGWTTSGEAIGPRQFAAAATVLP